MPKRGGVGRPTTIQLRPMNRSKKLQKHPEQSNRNVKMRNHQMFHRYDTGCCDAIFLVLLDSRTCNISNRIYMSDVYKNQKKDANNARERGVFF